MGVVYADVGKHRSTLNTVTQKEWPCGSVYGRWLCLEILAQPKAIPAVYKEKTYMALSQKK